MSNDYAQAHHLTTSDGATAGNHTSGNTTFGDHSNIISGRDAQTGTYARDQAHSAPRETNTVSPQEDFITPAAYNSQRDQSRTVHHEHEPHSSISQGNRGPLASTESPFQTATTDGVSKSNVPPTSSVGQQNAPGRAGEVGEKAMSAMGFGGNHVERPKEEQGLGEKIVNFLGA